MQIKIILFGIAILVLAGISAAQSVNITPKKTTYTRPKPIMEYKKTFTVTRPVIKAGTPALSKKIANTVSFERVMKLDVKEELSEVQWLEEADFEVLYNKNNILAIRLSVHGSGAYPWGSDRTVVVNLSTGNAVAAADVFEDLDGLRSILGTRQEAEAKKAVAEIKADPDNKDINVNDFFSERTFTADDLEGFSVGDDGITFTFDYGFPHVVKALEPDGKYFMTWNELRPFIKRGGLLGRFVS